eukprot:6172471-Pleurochrysis_carterae.AAC.1
MRGQAEVYATETGNAAEREFPPQKLENQRGCHFEPFRHSADSSITAQTTQFLHFGRAGSRGRALTQSDERKTINEEETLMGKGGGGE